jgi:hypothetical protein
MDITQAVDGYAVQQARHNPVLEYSVPYVEVLMTSVRVCFLKMKMPAVEYKDSTCPCLSRASQIQQAAGMQP